MTDDRHDHDVTSTPASARDDESTFSLITRAQRGDEEAFNRLLARHVTPLRRWASGRLPVWARGVTDTDDLVQDTLLRTFRRMGDFEPRGGGALQAYLREAVLNRIRDEIRRKSRRGQTTGLDDVEADRALSPLELAIGREAVDRYERALDRLRPDEREAIIGRIEMGYSYQELAETLGKPSAEAARKSARRALVRLLQEMRRAGH